jgi:hypothetical protein
MQVAGIRGWSVYGACLAVLVVIGMGAIAQLLFFYRRSGSKLAAVEAQ